MTLPSRWVSCVWNRGGNLTPEAEHWDIRAGLFTLMGGPATVTQSNKRTRCNVILWTNRSLFTVQHLMPSRFQKFGKLFVLGQFCLFLYTLSVLQPSFFVKKVQDIQNSQNTWRKCWWWQVWNYKGGCCCPISHIINIQLLLWSLSMKWYIGLRMGYIQWDRAQFTTSKPIHWILATGTHLDYGRICIVFGFILIGDTGRICWKVTNCLIYHSQRLLKWYNSMDRED